MATKKKMLQAAAGNAGGGAGLNVEDVFSTYLYTGNGGNKTITNGIDLDGEGGLVWIKSRDAASPHNLANTNSGAGKYMNTAATWAEVTNASGINAFNSDGFSTGNEGDVNRSDEDYASWTFRKAPKFFDVVTYTGDGVEGRTVSHNLGVAPAFIIIKKTNSSEDWLVGTDFTSTDFKNLKLNTTDGATTQAYASPFNSFAAQPSSTEITLSFVSTVNGSGDTYVAYLFAHNDGDGEFGADGDADIIKCGSYTGNGSTDGPEIDLGFEPQWLMVKRADSTSGWSMWDSMRGVVTGGNDQRIYANESSAEVTTSGDDVYFTATGFGLGVTYPYVNASGGTYIYIAIRRGTKVPESGTEVFDMSYWGEGDPNTSPKYESTTMSFVDMGISTNITGSNKKVGDRLRQGKELITNSNNAEGNEANHNFDYQGGYFTGTGTSTNNKAWMWKRAPGYFDAVAYSGNGTAGRTVSHNLGVVPEMMWVKRRDGSGSWVVYHSATTASDYLYLDYPNAAGTTSVMWDDTAPTDSTFSLGNYYMVNDSSMSYIAYLFASLDGISKVFSVTKSSGSDASVNCGFSAGPRFVMLKRTDSTGDWYVWDTERGIVAGNDPYLLLNSTAAEVTSTDYIDPTSNGFTIVNGGLADGNYIGYAVA